MIGGLGSRCMLVMCTVTLVLCNRNQCWIYDLRCSSPIKVSNTYGGQTCVCALVFADVGAGKYIYKLDFAVCMLGMGRKNP